jgi:hypothetical protein
VLFALGPLPAASAFSLAGSLTAVALKNIKKFMPTWTKKDRRKIDRFQPGLLLRQSTASGADSYARFSRTVFQWKTRPRTRSRYTRASRYQPTTGTGKTGIALGLLREACLNGYRGRFYNAQALLDELYASLADRTTARLLKRLSQMQPLVIDLCGVSIYVERFGGFDCQYGISRA